MAGREKGWMIRVRIREGKIKASEDKSSELILLAGARHLVAFCDIITLHFYIALYSAVHNVDKSIDQGEQWPTARKA